MKKAFKKVASIALASSMLVSAVAFAAPVVDPAELQDGIKAAIEEKLEGVTYTIADDKQVGSAHLVLDADTDVKKDEDAEYGDKAISKTGKSSDAQNGKVSLTGDFKSTLDMTKVQDAFKAYQTAAEAAVGEDALKQAALNLVPVTGQFTISVIYDARMKMSDKTITNHTTAGSMYGFNEEAKRVFNDSARELIEGKAVLADGTEAVVVNKDGTTTPVTGYNTLKITVDVVAPPSDYAWEGKTGNFANMLVYADLAKSLDDLLGDISYTVDDVTVNEAYKTSVYFTESISMAGSIEIGGSISTISFSTQQAKGGENSRKVENWQDISATMALLIESRDGGGGSITPNYTPVVSTPAPVETATPDPNATLPPDTPSSTIPPYTPADNKVPSKLNGDDHYVYIIGYPEGDVRPEGNITREEVATIFYRILDAEYRDSIYTKNHNYSDVELSRWSNKAIATLTNAEAAHLQGYPDGTFKPSDDMTRLEFIQLATSFLDESDSEVSYLDNVRFTDVIAKHAWGQEALQKAAIAELIDEDERTNFRPDDKIKRHEAMKIINRLLVRNVKEGGLIDGYVEWPDNPKDAKYFYEVVEATNSHTFDRLADGYEQWKTVDQNWIWGEFKTQYEDPDEIDKQ